MLLSIMAAVSSCKNSGGEASLKYEKYKLDNGLEVVLHPDSSDPVVSLAIQYHVGSNREKPGKTGFAHFFEHMLFQRSENLPRNAFFQKIDEMGGSFNGGTSNDGTVYFETVPRNALEKVLWMESDRMGYFINTVTEGGLKREIDVVSNEKRQGENAPYGLAYDLLFKNLFPAGHPYSWTVIGEIPDLRSATVEDVKEFYNLYYTPGNATLVLAGDFDPAQARELIQKYFGEIPARPNPAAPQVQNVTLDSTKRIEHEDPFCNAPMLLVAYPAVEAYAPDGYALDLLSNLLSGDKKSPMYQVLVEERKLVPSVDMYNYQMELAGLMFFNATTFPGVKLDDVQAGIEEAYSRFEQQGVDPKDLERYLAIEETRAYNRLTSTQGKAIGMAHSNVFGGSPDRMLKELAEYRKVTPADILRVYEKYIKGKNYLSVSIVPQGQRELAITGSTPAVVEQEAIHEQELNSQEGAIVDDPYERTPSAFDRSVEPGLLPNTPELNVPAIWTSQLESGMEVRGIRYTELPLVNFAVELNNGMLLDTPRKAGLAKLTAALLNEGTADKTAAELEEAIGQLGARLSIQSSYETMVITGNCLLNKYPELVKLIEEVLTRPRWDTASFSLVKERTLDNIRQNATEPSAIGGAVFRKLLFGGDNILGYTPDGTEESVSALTLEDVKNFYTANFSQSIAKFNFVGGLDQRQVEKSLASLRKNWAATPVIAPQLTEPAVKPAAKLYFVDYPGSRQSYIVVGSKSVPQDSPEAYPCVVVNDHLGASTSSLLFDILRLQRGYTYGAYSNFNTGIVNNTFTARSSVQATVTKESVDLFREILTGYGEGFTQQDLDATTSSLLSTMNGSFETPNALLNLLRQVSVYHLPEDYPKQREALLKTMTLDEAKGYIARNLNYEDMIIVVVGDAATQLAGLKQLNLGTILQVDKDGKLVK